MSNQDLKSHWENVYNTKKDQELGWYEDKAENSLQLIKECNLRHDQTILHVGAGTTTLVSDLFDEGFQNQLAVDISAKSLEKLQNHNPNIATQQADLTENKALEKLPKVDLWHDRAVLHFFDPDGQKVYFDNLRSVVTQGGFVILSTFSKGGATRCSGLDIFQHDLTSFENGLGEEFELINHFDHVYVNPYGHNRPFIYALFRRK